MNTKILNGEEQKNKKRLRSTKSRTSIELLTSLMKEIDLNAKVQQELFSYANLGESFPYIPKKMIRTVNRKEEAPLKPLKLPARPLQRTKSKIELLGVYEREQFRPSPSKTRPPEEKERFQDIMAFGKYFAPESNIKDYSAEPVMTISAADLFDEIVMEIKERRDFLDDMRELGHEKKYVGEIQYQISQRLQELENLDKDKAQAFILKHGM